MIQTPSVTVISLAIQAHPSPISEVVVAAAAVAAANVEKNRKNFPRDENVYILINVFHVL